MSMIKMTLILLILLTIIKALITMLPWSTREDTIVVLQQFLMKKTMLWLLAERIPQEINLNYIITANGYNVSFFWFFSYFNTIQDIVCTLSAKDRGGTKNPAVDLELILMHHFSRILCLSSLDLSSVLSTALSLTSLISKITQNMVDQKC